MPRPARIHALPGRKRRRVRRARRRASGAVTPDAGTIYVHGSRVPRLSPVDALRLGVAIVHQNQRSLPDLTVRKIPSSACHDGSAHPGAADRLWATRALGGVGSEVSFRTCVSRTSTSPIVS
jgi:hypothetical protein